MECSEFRGLRILTARYVMVEAPRRERHIDETTSRFSATTCDMLRLPYFCLFGRCLTSNEQVTVAIHRTPLPRFYFRIPDNGNLAKCIIPEIVHLGLELTEGKGSVVYKVDVVTGVTDFYGHHNGFAKWQNAPELLKQMKGTLGSLLPSRAQNHEVNSAQIVAEDENARNDLLVAYRKSLKTFHDTNSSSQVYGRVLLSDPTYMKPLAKAVNERMGLQTFNAHLSPVIDLLSQLQAAPNRKIMVHRIIPTSLECDGNSQPDIDLSWKRGEKRDSIIKVSSETQNLLDYSVLVGRTMDGVPICDNGTLVPRYRTGITRPPRLYTRYGNMANRKVYLVAWGDLYSKATGTRYDLLVGKATKILKELGAPVPSYPQIELTGLGSRSRDDLLLWSPLENFTNNWKVIETPNWNEGGTQTSEAIIYTPSVVQQNSKMKSSLLGVIDLSVLNPDVKNVVRAKTCGGWLMFSKPPPRAIPSGQLPDFSLEVGDSQYSYINRLRRRLSALPAIESKAAHALTIEDDNDQLPSSVIESQFDRHGGEFLKPWSAVYVYSLYGKGRSTGHTCSADCLAALALNPISGTNNVSPKVYLLNSSLGNPNIPNQEVFDVKIFPNLKEMVLRIMSDLDALYKADFIIDWTCNNGIKPLEKYLNEIGLGHVWYSFIRGRLLISLDEEMEGEAKKLRDTSLLGYAGAIAGVVSANVTGARLRALLQVHGEVGIRFLFQRTVLIKYIDHTQGITQRLLDMALTFGIDVPSVHGRGTQYRVEALLMEACRSEWYIFPSSTSEQIQAMPMTVSTPLTVEPKGAFYEDPVVVIDFTSMYPSIIMAYNICYSTALGDGTGEMGIYSKDYGGFGVDQQDLDWLGPDGINTCPNGSRFIKGSVQLGVVPKICHDLLSSRAFIKKCIAEVSKIEGNRARKHERVLDNFQLSLKLVANIVVGYMNATFSGRMPNSQLGDAVVATGRLMLKKSIVFVETLQWLQPCSVVYADTDSLFINLPGRTVVEAERIGKTICRRISSGLREPMGIKYEKVYQPCALITKKQYFGRIINEHGKSKLEFKGLEAIRRDTPPVSVKITMAMLSNLLENIGGFTYRNLRTRLLDFCRRLLSGRLPACDFIRYGKLRPIESYSSNPPQVQAFRTYIETGGGNRGSRRCPSTVVVPLDSGRYLTRAVTGLLGSPGGGFSFFPLKGAMPDETVSGSDKVHLFNISNTTSAALERLLLCKARGVPFEIDLGFYLAKAVMPPIFRILSLIKVSSNRVLEKPRSLFYQTPFMTDIRKDVTSLVKRKSFANWTEASANCVDDKIIVSCSRCGRQLFERPSESSGSIYEIMKLKLEKYVSCFEEKQKNIFQDTDSLRSLWRRLFEHWEDELLYDSTRSSRIADMRQMLISVLLPAMNGIKIKMSNLINIGVKLRRRWEDGLLSCPNNEVSESEIEDIYDSLIKVAQHQGALLSSADEFRCMHCWSDGADSEMKTYLGLWRVLQSSERKVELFSRYCSMCSCNTIGIGSGRVTRELVCEQSWNCGIYSKVLREEKVLGKVSTRLRTLGYLTNSRTSAAD